MLIRLRLHRGVTFFEITLVFSVIAVLIALIFLGTRRLMVETQITRVREDHRAISRALQNYFVDHYDFPSRESGGLTALRSAPVIYLASIPRDLFANRGETGRDYVYRTYDDYSHLLWVLVSRGPDGDLDIDQAFSETDDRPALTAAVLDRQDDPALSLTETLINLDYDPTNGLRSSGDILTISPFATN